MTTRNRKIRLRYVRQRDAMQCGVASLAMVCSALGVRYSLDTLERYCHPTKEGVSMKGIADGAHALGLEAKAYRLKEEQLRELFSPEACKRGDAPEAAILHWNQNHFTVVYGMNRRGTRYKIADPGKGMMTVSRDELRHHWGETDAEGEHRGIAMFMEPTEEFGKRVMPDSEESEKEKRSWRFLWGYVVRYKRYFLRIGMWLGVGSVLQLILPFLTQAIVDVGIARRSIGIIWLILLGELMIVAGRTLTDFLRRRLLLHISLHVNISLLSDFFIKLLRLPMGFFDTKLMGDLLQRMNDHSRVESFLTQQTLNIMFTAVSFVVFGVVLAVYDWVIFAVFLAGSVAYGAWIASFLERRKVLDYEMFECSAINSNVTYQFVTCMQEIKLQGCSGRRRKEWEDRQKELFAIQMKSLRLQQTQEAGSVFINEVKNILITVLAAMAVINGSITLGAMLAIQFIVGQLNSPVAQFMGFLYSIQDVRISLERINQIHGGADEQTPPEGKTLLTAYDTENGETGGLELKGVTFRYDLHSPVPTLDDISLKIPRGKVTAIVGASGSGKSTIMKLLLGYYPVENGEILLNGKPLHDYDLQWWRSRCGAVMQEGVIFSESIARNIAAADGEPDMERIRVAASTACIDTYVEGLPLRYETKIGRDGMGLSQGQRQRILIARAVYRNPEFIFLDEATNSLDAANERAITENLANFYRGRTVVVIAHRLSTVRDADNIIVMDKGRIAETGTHAALTASQGVYYTLVKNQLELGDS